MGTAQGSTKGAKHGPTASLLAREVWDKASKSMPRFWALTFWTLVSVPVALTAAFLVTFAHDLVMPTRAHYCWAGQQGGVSVDWAGRFVHWLSVDRSGHIRCDLVPPPSALLVYFLVFPPTWVLIIRSSWSTRRLRRDRGIIRDLVEKVFQAADPSLDSRSLEVLQGYLGQVEKNAQTLVILRALEKAGRGTKTNHTLLAIVIQLVMLAFDVSKGFTLRWVLWYQVLWFSFSTTVLQVRPLVNYCAFLSTTLIDFYIELVRARRGSWLELMQWHHQLELDILTLWGKVNLHAALPSLPFFSFALVHFLTDEDVVFGAVVATFLLAVSGLVLVLVLIPISRISSMFNSGLAFKAGPRLSKGQLPERTRRPHTLSIVAAARSMALEEPERSAAEELYYGTFLEYVQGHEVSVALGIPGWFMVPIKASTVTQTFTTFIVKLPLFVSLVLSARHQVQKHSEL